MQRSVLKRFAPVVAAAFASAILSLGCTEDGLPDPTDNDGYVEVPTDGKSVETLISDGHTSLEDGAFDEALAYYEAAYQKDRNNPNAIAYSVLAKIAGISIDRKVTDLLKNRVGLTGYPNRLNALLSSDWLTNYTERYVEYSIYDYESGRYAYWYDEWDVDYGIVDRVGYYIYDYRDGISGYFLVTSEPVYYEYENFLPGLATPEWVKGGPNSLYTRSLVDGAPGMETFAILLLANLLDKNTAGLNGLLDDLIDAVFGSGFDEICARVDGLKGKGSINLDREFLDALNFDDLIDEFDRVGWAEVNAVTSFMTAIKASLQWVASYNWDTNLNFLKFAWDTEENFYNKVKNVNASDLPFGNNFLKARDGKMAVAKASFKKAVEGLKLSYEAIQNDDKYPQVVKDAYPTLKAGADQLIAAIDGGINGGINGGIFYILDSDPTTTSSWPTSGNGIDMGKIFAEGYFSLDKLFETDGGKPVFYAMSDYQVCDYDDYWEYCRWEDRDPERLTPANYHRLLEDSYAVALMLKTSHVAGIVVGPDAPVDVENIPFSLLPPKYGQLLFEKFYGLQYTTPVAKARVKAVAHAGK